MKTVRKTAEDEIALTAKAATPAPVPKEAVPLPNEKPAAIPQPRAEMAKLTTPAPPARAARESGYQPEQEQNRIEGSISNLGRKSVDSIATPMGKFKKLVNTRIGSRWTHYVQNPPQPGLYSFGTVKVSFFITQDGKVEGLKVLSNSANASFAEMCLAAISDARAEKPEDFRPPEGALEAMRDRRLEYFLTFTYYSY
jgi:outer membrane biosynthesis protein TonB